MRFVSFPEVSDLWTASRLHELVLNSVCSWRSSDMLSLKHWAEWIHSFGLYKTSQQPLCYYCRGNTSHLYSGFIKMGSEFWVLISTQPCSEFLVFHRTGCKAHINLSAQFSLKHFLVGALLGGSSAAVWWWADRRSSAATSLLHTHQRACQGTHRKYRNTSSVTVSFQNKRTTLILHL